MVKEIVKIGYVGLGRRGNFVLSRCFPYMKDVEVATVCDLLPERAEKGADTVFQITGKRPKITQDYHDILNDPEINAVIVMTGWHGRPAIAVEAMRAGKYCGVEVGCADTLEECFDLVRAYEETGVPIMMLENCCYGRREMAVLNLVKQGLFGEIVHATGGYMHYLNNEEFFYEIENDQVDHYRLGYYIARNRESYPTHELGPISKVLSINRGNRMVRLNSFSSKSCGLKDYAMQRFGSDSQYAKTDYKQGDIFTTIITCAGGQTIQLTLDTTLPRAHYSRNFSIRGTRGMSNEDSLAIFLEGMEEPVRGNEEEMLEKYDHPIHKEYEKTEKPGGHGGIDWLVCRAFIESVKHGTQTPIDAYDAATWMSIGPLSEMSIAQNGAPVDIPDFTNGKWMNREPAVRQKFCLDEIVVDEDTPIIP